MKIKVCGLRDPGNIEAVVAIGVDYVGFIFYGKSARYVGDTELAAWLQANAASFADVKKVGVFVNAEVDYILNTVHDYQLDFVQLHGDESPVYCRELKLLWSVSTLRRAGLVKAFRVTPDFDFAATSAYADSCDFFVFDTGGRADYGGTGAKWDWTKLTDYRGDTPFLLSGGIGLEDAAAVAALDHPQLLGVDVNSGFEDAPAQKDVAALARFVNEVR